MHFIDSVLGHCTRGTWKATISINLLFTLLSYHNFQGIIIIWITNLVTNIRLLDFCKFWAYY